MQDIFNNIYDQINKAVGIEIVSVILTAVIIILLTLLLTAAVTKLLKKLLTKTKSQIPAMTIYLNIARICCWLIGLSVLFSTCFGIDMSAFLTALGVGGIAVSLGFKDTIANLISGVQVTGMKLMEPGDHVMIANMTGTVKDTTWRHTEIENLDGETIIVPNSVINSTAIVKKTPFETIRVHVEIHCKSQALNTVSDEIRYVVRQAVVDHGQIEGDVSIKFSSISDKGAKGSVSVTMKDPVNRKVVSSVKDSIVRAIAPYVEAAKQ